MKKPKKAPTTAAPKGPPPAVTPAPRSHAELYRRWARLILALDRAAALADQLALALDVGGDEGDPGIHADTEPTPLTGGWPGLDLMNAAGHAAWQLENLAVLFSSDAPGVVSALTGQFTPDDPVSVRALELWLARMGATAADREEFGLPPAK